MCVSFLSVRVLGSVSNTIARRNISKTASSIAPREPLMAAEVLSRSPASSPRTIRKPSPTSPCGDPGENRMLGSSPRRSPNPPSKSLLEAYCKLALTFASPTPSSPSISQTEFFSASFFNPPSPKLFQEVATPEAKLAGPVDVTPTIARALDVLPNSGPWESCADDTPAPSVPATSSSQKKRISWADHHGKALDHEVQFIKDDEPWRCSPMGRPFRRAATIGEH